METGTITTPFGRRSMTLAMMSSQLNAAKIEPGKTTGKWKLYRALCDARELLGVTDRALAVMNALLSFYPDSELSEERSLVVFPSNDLLITRSNGMAPATLRRHLSTLITAGLISRKDSPNGKRYARKNGDGEIEDAFGFNLAPLLARSDEIHALAARVQIERQEARRAREQLTLCRRDIAKLIEAAMEEGIPANWEDMHSRYRDIVLRIPRNHDHALVAMRLAEMDSLRHKILIIMETHINTKKLSANESRNERHIQNSNIKLTTEYEPAQEKGQGKRSVQINTPTVPASTASKELNRPEPLYQTPPKPFALPIVLGACPEIRIYGPDGNISNWRDLMTAAVTVRSMLGVSPSAYEDACDAMGPENAATVMACILERAGHINSAGGYLRNLSQRAQRGEFSIGPMLMALSRTNAGSSGRFS